MYIKSPKQFHLPPLPILFWITILSLFLRQTGNAKAVLYDGRDGLNSNDISSIAKDDRGLMWLGTANGLNIFDGYNFSKFEGVLFNKGITALKLNPDKKELMVGTTTGMFVINLTTFLADKITVDTKGNKGISLEKINKITYNPFSKEVFYSVRNSIYKVQNDRTSVLICKLRNPNGLVSNMRPYDKDHLLLNDSLLYLLDTRTGKYDLFTAFKNVPSVNKVYRAGDTLLINDFDSKIYITSIKDYETHGENGPTIFSHILPYRPVHSFLKGNKLYSLCENYRFIIHDIKTGATDEVSKKYPDIFEGKVFYSIFVDENSITWIGTNKGLIKVEERAVTFSKVLNSLPQRISTRKIFEDTNGDLYVCSYSGLMYFSKETQKWSKYITNNPALAAKYPRAFEGSVYPLCILPKTPETFYLGYDYDELLTFNKTDKIFETQGMRYDNADKKLNSIYDFAFDNNGKLWMAGYNGTAIYDPKTNIAKLQDSGPFSVGNVRVRMVQPDKQNNLMYIGSSNGLFVFDANTGLKRHFTTTTVPALSNNDVLFVCRDKQNNLWLGTNGGGINVISADYKTIKYIRKQDGLSNEIVYSMIPENDNVFWIATFNGLDRYQIDQQSFTNFFEEDGLSSNEFNQNSFLRTRDGKFYFGSINGITTFYPQQFVQQPPFNIYFAGISKWDNKTQTIHLHYKNLPVGSTITKSPSDELIELHFGCTDYSDPQRNSYSYRIKEISNNWISLDDRHSLSIGGLPYGLFTLEIKAINGRGATSSNTLLYYLKIAQPFYRTWWFFGLILIFVVMVFYAAYLIKSHNFKNVLHLRMKIASNLHDEVGSLLTRITMFSDNLRYSKNNEEQRNIKLEKIAVLSRNAVASMSDVLWAIDSRNDFAGNLLDRMREQAEEMLFPLGIDVNFVLLVNDLKKPIHSDIRGEIYLIFKEAINNIVKHSNATEVEITYKLADKHFYLKISNNGIVESISDISTGQGLNNMKMRAKKIGAQIKIERKDDIFSVELND